MSGGERIILHEDPRSGNCYKIRLTATLLGLPFVRRTYDIMKGETRTPEFWQRSIRMGAFRCCRWATNFFPKAMPPASILPTAAAWCRKTASQRADMLRWMFFEQYNHEPNIATLRFWLIYIGLENLSEEQRVLVPPKRIAGQAALELMDRHLANRDWFVGQGATLADVVLYAYTHVAEAGGFRLADLEHVCAWLDRVAELPGYVPMD